MVGLCKRAYEGKAFRELNKELNRTCRVSVDTREMQATLQNPEFFLQAEDAVTTSMINSTGMSFHRKLKLAIHDLLTLKKTTY